MGCCEAVGAPVTTVGWSSWVLGCAASVSDSTSAGAATLGEPVEDDWGLADAEPMIVPESFAALGERSPVTTIPTATSSRTAITAATGRSHAGERRASSGRGKPSASNGAAV